MPPNPDTILAPAELAGYRWTFVDDKLTLAESAALECLCSVMARRSPTLLLLDADERLDMPPPGQIFDRVVNGAMPHSSGQSREGIIRGANQGLIGPQFKLHLNSMESELGKTSNCGEDDFTAADIQPDAARCRAGLDST